MILTLAVSSCASKSTTQTGQRVSIQVTEQGFEPAVVNVKAGQPVTLFVKRTTDRTCATELVMTEHNINQPLPLNQEVEITFTPTRSGDLVYACAMDMYKGTIHVE
jgi:plastocyanin domain-containing protein